MSKPEQHRPSRLDGRDSHFDGRNSRHHGRESRASRAPCRKLSMSGDEGAPFPDASFNKRAAPPASVDMEADEVQPTLEVSLNKGKSSANMHIASFDPSVLPQSNRPSSREVVGKVSFKKVPGIASLRTRLLTRLGRLPGRFGHHASSTLSIAYADRGGVLRNVELRMSESKVGRWVKGLRRLLKRLPYCGSAAHWRWTLACMAATSERGATGFLRQVELRSLLRRANASSGLSTTAIEEALDAVQDRAERMKLPDWLRPVSAGDGRQHKLLDARHIAGMLLWLCTASQTFARLFHEYSFEGQMHLAQWLRFVRVEQLMSDDQAAGASASCSPPAQGDGQPHADDDDEEKYGHAEVDEELAWAEDLFNRVVEGKRAGYEDVAFDALDFSLQLLDSQNNAVDSATTVDVGEPLASYWTSCSHNSYIVGDQVTGLSSANMYRRQLLQGCRHLEIDCWDGRSSPCSSAGQPIVTHGNTFCTVEKFEAVIKAVAECAFINSEMPVMLSLEMHCSPSQQRQLATMGIQYLGEALLKFDEVVATGRAISLSPANLRCRVLFKGKVRTKGSLRASRFSLRQLYSRASGASASGNDLRRTSDGRESALGARSSMKGCGRGSTGDFQLSRGSTRDFLKRSSSAESIRRDSIDSSADDDEMTPCPRLNKKSAGMVRAGVTAASGGARPPARLDEPSMPITPRACRNSCTALCQKAASRPQSRTRRESDGSLAFVDNLDKARRKLYRSKSLPKALINDTNSGSRAIVTDPFYADCVCLRSLPVGVFLGTSRSQWVLPITSINEDRLLKELGIPRAERGVIEGLQIGRPSPSATGVGLTEEQQSSRAIVRLAATPPPEVGVMQQRTAQWLCRPFPLGLRFSGKNMSPLPGWLAGAHHIALNMSNNDLAVQLHHALFKASDGYVLKPPEMHLVAPESRTTDPSESDQVDSEDAYWPPARDSLHCTTVEVISLHNAPKRGEQRPSYEGSRGACHAFHSELSGGSVPPDNTNPSCPGLTLSIHPIGGFCAVSDVLPLPQTVETELSLPAQSNGMHATFHEKIHFVAAEPHATFLRVNLTDGGQEVAYETAVLGRLARGYRVFRLRGQYGTRLELCFLFVRITFEVEANLWVSPRQAKMHNIEQRKRSEELLRLLRVNEQLKEELAKSRRRTEDVNELPNPGVDVNVAEENAVLKQELARLQSAETATDISTLHENAILKEEVERLRRKSTEQEDLLEKLRGSETTCCSGSNDVRRTSSPLSLKEVVRLRVLTSERVARASNWSQSQLKAAGREACNTLIRQRSTSQVDAQIGGAAEKAQAADACGPPGRDAATNPTSPMTPVGRRMPLAERLRRSSLAERLR